jgi:DNA primase catalytic core
MAREKIAQVIEKLKGQLEEYMIKENIRPPKGARMFSCPNKNGHKNGDEHPSASLYREDGVLKWSCHTCKAGSDIFEMARYREGLPVEGPEFITKTIKTLCEKLGIEFDIDESLTDAEKSRLELHSVNKLVSDYLTDHQSKVYLQKRDIDEHIAQRLGIGTISTDDLQMLLNSNNIDMDVAIRSSLYTQACPGSYTGGQARMMFNEHCMVFTIKDVKGNVVGFTSRNMAWTKESKYPKYCNSPNNEVFDKSKVLYLIDKAKTKVEESGTVYIVEGPMDAMRIYASGVQNVVCLMGTAFTEHHLNMLKSIGATHLIFALDGDDAGQTNMETNIDDIIKMDREIKISVKILQEGSDPDSLIQEKGVGAFLDLPTYEYPEYVAIKMVNRSGVTQEDSISEYIRWLIANVQRPISRGKFIEKLAKLTGKDYRILSGTMDYYLKLDEIQASGKIEQSFSGMIREWRNTPIEQKMSVLDKGRKEMSLLLWQAKDNIIQANKTDLQNLKDKLSTAESNALRTGFPRFDENVIIPKTDSRILLGAYANIGKSNITRNLAWRIIDHNPDVSVLYCSLDDPKIKTIPAFIGMIENHVINNIRYPKSLPQPQRETTESALNSGFRKLNTWIDERRLIIKDQVDIPTVAALESHIIAYQDELKDTGKSLVVFVDSLHSFMDLTNGQDIRGSVIQAITEMKRLSTTYHATIIMNGELNKEGRYSGKRPTLANLSETARLEYLIDVGGIVHSEMFYKKQNTERKWDDPNFMKNGVPIQFPIIEIDIEKNKEGYTKGDIWFKMNPIVGRIMEMTEKDEEDILEKERDAKVKR